MINEKIINIAIDAEQQEKVRKNSASSLPLNPTAQGWSAQKIREKLYRAICSDVGDLDDNLLDIIVDKLLSVKDIFVALQTGEFVVKKAELSEGGQNIEITLQDLKNRMNNTEQDIYEIENGTTVVGKALKDDLGNTIKSTYANKLDLVYSSSNNRIAITLKSYDGTSIDADLIDLPKATTSADGLLAKEDKVKINNIASDIASMGATKQSLSEKNQINGYAGLDNNAKIPSSLLPDSVLGQLEYKGTFTPTAYPLSPEKGWFYISIGNGTINGVDFQVGDWAVFNGTTWDKVDNTDAVMSVNGKIGVVVINGTDIKVGNGDTWTIEQRIVNIYAELNNRYTKAETYTQNEIEQRITDLLGMANLQDILIGSYTNGQTILASDLSAYNFVVALGNDDGALYTGIFKPSEINLGDTIFISKNPDVSLTRGTTDFTITTPTSIKMWGIKLDGITADEIGYGDKTVEDALNDIFEPEYTTATHLKLTNEITATNNVEIIDDTGTVLEIDGNEPTNLIVNGDFSNGLTGWATSYNAALSVENGYLKVIKSAASNISSFNMTTPTGIIGDKYFYSMDIKTSGTDYFQYAGIYNSTGTTYVVDKTTSMRTSPMYDSSNGAFSNFTRISSLNTLTDNPVPEATNIRIATSGAQGSIYYLDNIKLYNVSEMMRSGYKADDGRLLSALSDTELELQMNTWDINGFPTAIEKILSKSDNLLDGTFNKITSLESENLITNGDFSNGGTGWTPTPNTATETVTFTDKATLYSQNGTMVNILQTNILTLGVRYYISLNTTIRSGRIAFDGFVDNVIFGSGTFNSFVSSARITYFGIKRFALELTDFDVDNIRIYNITDLVDRGIIPGGLTNAQYKELLDNKMFDNVPLRETNYISVEPNKAYKLIKVSGNDVTHKVIEYTKDDQVVRVNTVTYTANKYTFTTHALTAKVKLVSDLMKRPAQLLTNPYFNNGTTGWAIERSTLAVNNGVMVITPDGSADYAGFYQNINWAAGEEYYNKVKIRTTTPNIYSFGFSIWTDGNREYIPPFINPVQNQWYTVSAIYTPNVTATSLKVNNRRKTTITNAEFANERIEVEYRLAYNITTFKRAGVVNDTGTSFAKLSNNEITAQMDIWTESGFPNHVIASLYPNGVDNAIAFKYNDADDIFRPQAIDELPLNLTLRSGEKWKDGYVIKQNGNAQYYPLQTKFSAWNYGQLEAIYASGIPADFKIQYAQNTGAQVKTTSGFLVEAREQLDYVTEGYTKLIDKLGYDVLGNGFDSFAGITSPTYEYYGLQGIKEGSELAIEGYGQSIQNLLSKATTIQTTQTVRGVTVTYASETGIYTVNGTSTAGAAFNIVLATGMDFGLPTGTPMQLMRYYDSGTINLNGSYVGYTITGASTSNRINENSESLYDPYINGSGNLSANHATNKQQVIFQVWAPGIVFTDFKFKIGIYEGLQLRPFILPTETPAKSNVIVYNRTLNNLNVTNTTIPVTAGVTITYDPYTQEFLLNGTATGTASVSLNATFAVKSGDRLSIKRLYQSGDVTGVGGVLPRLKLDNASNTTIVYNDIYKMTAPEGSTPTPDISFTTGTAPADATLTLKLGITSGQVFENYRFRLMIHNKSNDIGYVEYRKETIGTMLVGANEKSVIKFKAIPFGILEFVANNDSLNLLYGDSITDFRYSVLEYNAGIGSPNKKISALDERISSIDNVFKDKVIAVWGDSRESNNPTSDPQGVGDQKDTSWPALLAKKLKAKVLNYGLSGGAWAQNTVQQDAAAAIVNRVQTEDPTASADIIIISSMNDFKLATPLGSPTSRTITDYYGSLRLTFERLAAKYPGKKIVVVLPQKRFDENVEYGSGASYYAYRKAQIDVCKEYGISTVDLYNNLPNSKLGSAPTAYATYMLNDTHFSAAGNDLVAELVARHLIGNGNSGSVDSLPPLPSTDGTYTLKVVITGGIPVFSWVA